MTIDLSTTQDCIEFCCAAGQVLKVDENIAALELHAKMSNAVGYDAWLAVAEWAITQF